MSEIVRAPVFFSERLRFADMTEEDASFVVELRSDPNVYQYFLNPHQISLKEHLEWFRRKYVFDENRFDWIAFNANEERIGIFGIRRGCATDNCAEISYILSRDFYNNGFASEAVKRLIRFCWDEWKCTRIIAEIHKKNVPSFKLVKKLGFFKISCNDDFEIWELKYDSISC